MTEAEAAKWMKDFKDSRKDIPFDWPRDCCYTRAREMCNQLKAEGRTPGKVWNYAPPGEALKANTSNVKEGYVEWGYHVAPTVPVRRKDGTVTDMVLDPSLSDKPLTPDEWKALQGKPASTLVQSDAAPYYRAPDGRVMVDPGDSEVNTTLAGHRANRATEPK
jgi:hypothetical protein